MLKKIDPITLTIEETASEVDIPPFELINPDPATDYWHLLTDDRLLTELTSAGAPNLINALQATTPPVCNELKGISNKVRLVCADPAGEMDLCDALISARFTIAINTIADEYINYADWLIKHYTEHKTKEEVAGNLPAVCEHISWYANAFERDYIAQNIGRAFKIAKATITKEINQFISVREKDKVQIVAEGEGALPAWVDAEFYYRYGFVLRDDGPDNTGIYFTSSNGPKRLTNFTMAPLIHIYSKDSGNRRLTEFNNGRYKTVLELPGKAFTSMEFFDNILSDESALFTLDGFTKSHLNRLKSYFLCEYPKCFELNTLGWQPEGFYSFSNMIYKNALVEYNPYGIAEVDGVNYLSMGASNALEGVRQEDDIYKNDKFLSYNQSPIDFNAWCRMMVSVYPEHGMMAITFVMMTVFRDILFKRNNNFPILYFYGPIGSGKSKIAESVVNVFTQCMPMFNLNQGTDYSFFSRLGRFINVAVGLNEFDENAIKEEWFRAIKAAYDGEGREKGAGLKNKTTSQAIKVGIVMVGQYLTTKDDNAVLSRTIPRKTTEDTTRTVQQIALYDELKAHEQNGISSLICELLAHRQFVADNYLSRFVTCTSDLKAALTKDGITPKNRILENFTVALTMVSIMAEKLQLGFTYDAFLNDCRVEIGKLSNIMSESNSLSLFWKTVEFLLDQKIIEQGVHFRVETKNDVRISIDRKTTETKKFDEPKRLLFLRLGTIHMLYQKETRTQTGKNGLNEQTILTYMKEQPSYIGSNPGSHFNNSVNTSSYVFDYDLLGVNLERFKEDHLVTVTLAGKVARDAEIEDILGTAKLTFSLLQDEGYIGEQGEQVKKQVYTNCISEDTTMAMRLKRGQDIKVTGALSESRSGDRVNRRMKVTNIEVIQELFTADALPDSEVDSVFGEV